MPGIEQLKKFDNDITSVGEELTIRKKNGTIAPTVEIPANIPVQDDSLDFEFGLPGVEDIQPKTDEDTDAAAADMGDDGSGDDIFSGDEQSIGDTDNGESSTLPDATFIPSLDDLDPDIAAFLSGDQDVSSRAEQEKTQNVQTPVRNDPISDFAAQEQVPETLSEPDIPEAADVSPLSDFDTSALDDLLNGMEQKESESVQKSPEAPKEISVPFSDPEKKKTLDSADDTAFPSLSDAFDDFDTFDNGLGEKASEDADSGFSDFSAGDNEAERQTESAAATEAPFNIPLPGDMDGLDNAFTDTPLSAPADDFSDFDEKFNIQTGLSDEITEDSPLPPAGLDLDNAFSQALSGDSAAEEKAEDGLPAAPAEDAAGGMTFNPDTENFDNFEIPGFSDTVTVPGGSGTYGGPKKKGTAAAEDFDRTYLNDAEYKTFRENLHSYPLNLRIAVQQFIVKNEFTDAAVMEVVFKIIKKVPARQLASHLGKMLDTAISVPMNYERRTAEQYELYKKSLEYQLKNRIIPGAIAAVILGIFIYILSYFGFTFIYRPLKAESLYKAGYHLIQRDLYEQAETKFDEALTYKVKKKWFFKYARAYREKRQYLRAAVMYEQLIKRFKFDKQAGVEYASMEAEDLANYERAAEIVRRLILDHHINDKDAMLLLGDIYLDWGSSAGNETEKAEKFEEARLQYSTLIDLYGSKSLYLARMLRYFIRTDNLREVLPLKTYFTSGKKNMLPAPDLIELGGYLLEKQYGYLPPADEYLRAYIDNVKRILEQGIKADPSIPEGHYNLSRYFVRTGNSEQAKTALTNALTMFASAKKQTHARTLKHIDTYRLLGEQYAASQEYLLAERQYAEGISLFEQKKEYAELKSDKNIGMLYSDMADIDYFISGNIHTAARNYKLAVENGYDTPSIRYRIGFVQYNGGNYAEALGSFIKTASEDPLNRNLLLALGNVLSVRGDESAARGYYERLLRVLDADKERFGIVFPQVREDHHALVDLYLKTTNNLGVTLARLAVQTGNSTLRAQAVAQFSESVRAWDALTRNQSTMVRLEGSNLAAQNIKYISYPQTAFEPAIYAAIPRILYGESVLKQYALE